MRLEQMRYFFKYKEGEKKVDVNPEKIFLSLTGKITPLTLKKTFLEVQSVTEDEIKGYSIIDKLIGNGCKLLDVDAEEIVLYLKKRPLFQLNDEEIDDVDYEKFVNKLNELSTSVDTNGSGESDEIKPHTLEPEIPFEWSEHYLKAKKKLEWLGYKSHEAQGTGFFYKEDDIENNKIIFDAGEKIEVFKAEKIEDNEYKFEDSSNVLLVKFDEDKKPSFELTPKQKELPELEQEVVEEVTEVNPSLEEPNGEIQEL